MKKYAYLFLALFFTILSCSNSTNANTKSPNADVEKLYKIHCNLCHGINGKLGLGGAKDLTKSTMDLDQRIAIIRSGKGAMAAYEKILSKKEIKALAKYTMEL